MSVKERILTIRLMEKVHKQPSAAASLGILVKMDSRNDCCSESDKVINWPYIRKEK